jgi:hypothetical protein
MLNDILFIGSLAIIAAAWLQAIVATRKYPSRFNSPAAAWQIAATMAQERNQSPPAETAPTQPATISPISFCKNIFWIRKIIFAKF